MTNVNSVSPNLGPNYLQRSSADLRTKVAAFFFGRLQEKSLTGLYVWLFGGDRMSCFCLGLHL